MKLALLVNDFIKWIVRRICTVLSDPFALCSMFSTNPLICKTLNNITYCYYFILKIKLITFHSYIFMNVLQKVQNNSTADKPVQ